MFLSPTLEIERAPFTPGTVDPYGDSVDTWGPPASVLVYGFAPPSTESVSEPQARRAVEGEIDIYLPPGVACGDRDHWSLPVPGGVAVFEQQGAARDFNSGPFGFDPGLVVRVKKVEG